MSAASGVLLQQELINMSEFYAYGDDTTGIETVMRFHAVKRWHMIDTTRTQTLAEHSANVALLAFYIASECPGMFFGPSLPLAGLALLHDVPETFTGDIPSHTKKKISGIDELEHKVTPLNFKRGDMLDVHQRLLIKMCDLVDGIRFIRLHGVDVTAKHAREGLEFQLSNKIEESYQLGWPDAVNKFVRQTTFFYAYEKS